MSKILSSRHLICIAAFWVSTPALANTDAVAEAGAGGGADQSAEARTAEQGAPPARPKTVFDGDYLTIGAAVGVSPRFEGSDDYRLFPGGALIGSVGGVEFQARGPGLNVDLVPDASRAKVGVIAGPVVRIQGNRDDKAADIKDPQIAALGRLDTAVEIGAEVGVKVNRVISPVGNLTASVEARWDVADAHKGRVIAPRVTYFTPLSYALAASLTVQAEHGDDAYNAYYFSVTPAGSTASGLPTYQADAGWKSVGSSLFLAADLDGDVTNGGWGAFGTLGYSRLIGDAGRSSIVRDRDQMFALIGIGYTF